LFLLASLWGAAFTANALHPTFRGPRLAALSFAAGWLTSELAIHHAFWQLLATVAFGLAGAFEHAPGRLGLLVTFASWFGLYLAHTRSAKTAEKTEAALRESLGANYESEIAPDIERSLPTSINWRRIAAPFPVRRGPVERIRDIQYARDAGVDLLLDVYRPSDGREGCPVLFQIHGGGWMIGSKNEQALPLIYQLVASGWVCVAANYRLSPGATFPDHLIDCKRALHWIKKNVATYGGDPDFVAVTGGSAGGHLSSLVALTANDPEYQPGFEGVDTRVDACVPYYGVYDFTDRHGAHHHTGMHDFLAERVMKGSIEEIREAYERASPIARVHADAPPFFVVHGAADSLVPVGEARHFVAALREKTRAPVAYAELPGAQHAFELFASLRTLQTNATVARFLGWVYSRYRAAPDTGVAGA
jgi:acetyl esterase/lipase